MLIRFDSWLLEKFEKFSHWWQKLTGKDCFWLARFSAASPIAYTTIILVAAYVYEGLDGLFFQSMFFVLYITINLTLGFDLKRMEEEVERDQLKGCSNYSKLDVFGRMVGLCVLPFMGCVLIAISRTLLYHTPIFYLIINGFAPVSWLTALMFACCDPLPPAKSKVRKWLENMAERAKKLIAPIPELVPIRIPSR